MVKDVVVGTRIGVESSGDWAKKPLRFYKLGNKSISVKDKAAEERLGEGESKEDV